MTLERKYTATQFAEQLAAAAEAGEKIEALTERVAELTRKVERLSAKIEREPGNPPHVTAEGKSTKILYTIKEGAQFLSMSPATLRKHISQGNVPVVRHGHSYRVRHRDLEKFAGLDVVESVWPKDKPHKEVRARLREGKQ